MATAALAPLPNWDVHPTAAQMTFVENAVRELLQTRDEVDACDVAERYHVDFWVASAAIDELLRRGLVERVPNLQP